MLKVLSVVILLSALGNKFDFMSSSLREIGASVKGNCRIAKAVKMALLGAMAIGSALLAPLLCVASVAVKGFNAQTDPRVDRHQKLSEIARMVRIYY